MSIDQLTPDKPLSPQLGRGLRAWRDDYPWLHRAFEEAGPGARTASDSWRARIEDALKTTLDFKVRPDGTAAVWCGMSGYDFDHDPTPKELLGGLAEAYRRELERVGGRGPVHTRTWRMSVGAPTVPARTLVLTQEPPRAEASVRPAAPERPTPQPSVQPLAPPAEGSLAGRLGAVLLPRVVQLMLIFVAVTALTLVLSSIASSVR